MYIFHVDNVIGDVIDDATRLKKGQIFEQLQFGQYISSSVGQKIELWVMLQIYC